MDFLTIYIPSYNRGDLLIKQLEMVSKSMFLENINVIVSDNNSIDPKYEEIKKFCLEKNFTYKKNNFNDTGNPNIFKGFLYSFKSEYLWILSDNDLILDSTVDNIYEILKKNDLDLFLLAHNSYENFVVKSINQELLLNDLIIKSSGLGLISSVIYRSNFIKDNIYIGYDFIFSWFPHLSVLIKSFYNKSGKVGIVNKSEFFEDEEKGYVINNKFYYARSYFGFVFLAELFEQKNKIRFIKNYTRFWNLRHWFFYKRAPNVFFNEILAYGYLSRYDILFKSKLLIWKFIYLFLKNKE